MSVMLAPVQLTNRLPEKVGGSLVVDDLKFAIARSARRRTMQITVERNGELSLSAPPGVDRSELRAFVVEKRFWIYTKLAEKERFQRRLPVKEYVDGEGFSYLGRSHRLKVVAEQDVSLRLTKGRFMLRRDAVRHGRERFVGWYSEKGRSWLARRVAEYQSRMEVEPAGVRVQDLGYRWGSCGKGGWLHFHWKTILLPAQIAEYIVVHEMAHLQNPHHTADFWLRVERAMPDFARRSAWLAEHGIEVEGI
jgi:hypothetical protein